jgi:hypothetical protein
MRLCIWEFTNGWMVCVMKRRDFEESGFSSQDTSNSLSQISYRIISDRHSNHREKDSSNTSIKNVTRHSFRHRVLKTSPQSSHCPTPCTLDFLLATSVTIFLLASQSHPPASSSRTHRTSPAPHMLTTSSASLTMTSGTYAHPLNLSFS